MTHVHTLGEEELPSQGVYNAVSEVEGCSPLDLPPLAAAVDTEALDALLAYDSPAKRVSFEYCGYAVVADPVEVRID